MANELALCASLTFVKAGVTYPVGADVRSVADAVNNLLVTVSGSSFVENLLSVLTSATVIPLGGVTSPHWAFFQNLDATNFLRIRNGSTGADLLSLYPGELALCPLFITAVPYAIADTASCLLKYVILPK